MFNSLQSPIDSLYIEQTQPNIQFYNGIKKNLYNILITAISQCSQAQQQIINEKQKLQQIIKVQKLRIDELETIIQELNIKKYEQAQTQTQNYVQNLQKKHGQHKILLKNHRQNSRHSICNINTKYDTTNLYGNDKQQISIQNNTNRLSLQVYSDRKLTRVPSSNIKNKIIKKNTSSKQLLSPTHNIKTDQVCSNSNLQQQNKNLSNTATRPKIHRLSEVLSYQSPNKRVPRTYNCQQFIQFPVQKPIKYNIISPKNLNSTDNITQHKVITPRNLNQRNMKQNNSNKIGHKHSSSNLCQNGFRKKISKQNTIYQALNSNSGKKKCINVVVPIKMINVSSQLKLR